MVGTPEQNADKIELWFLNDGADGFNLMPPSQPDSIDDFVDLVVPILQQRELFRHNYSSDTLRGHLGIGIPI